MSKKPSLVEEAFDEAEMRTEALRFNAGKPQMSYLLSAPIAMAGLVSVLEYGAEKYERDNWKRGMTKESILDSMLRHQTALANGQVFDTDPNCPECNGEEQCRNHSGLRHSYHIMCNAMFLAEFDGRGDYDDE